MSVLLPPLPSTPPSLPSPSIEEEPTLAWWWVTFALLIGVIVCGQSFLGTCCLGHFAGWTFCCPSVLNPCNRLFCDWRNDLPWWLCGLCCLYRASGREEVGLFEARAAAHFADAETDLTRSSLKQLTKERQEQVFIPVIGGSIAICMQYFCWLCCVSLAVFGILLGAVALFMRWGDPQADYPTPDFLTHLRDAKDDPQGMQTQKDVLVWTILSCAIILTLCVLCSLVLCVVDLSTVQDKNKRSTQERNGAEELYKSLKGLNAFLGTARNGPNAQKPKKPASKSLFGNRFSRARINPRPGNDTPLRFVDYMQKIIGDLKKKPQEQSALQQELEKESNETVRNGGVIALEKGTPTPLLQPGTMTYPLYTEATQHQPFLVMPKNYYITHLHGMLRQQQGMVGGKELDGLPTDAPQEEPTAFWAVVDCNAEALMTKDTHLPGAKGNDVQTEVVSRPKMAEVLGNLVRLPPLVVDEEARDVAAYASYVRTMWGGFFLRKTSEARPRCLVIDVKQGTATNVATEMRNRINDDARGDVFDVDVDADVDVARTFPMRYVALQITRQQYTDLGAGLALRDGLWLQVDVVAVCAIGTPPVHRTDPDERKKATKAHFESVLKKLQACDGINRAGGTYSCLDHVLLCKQLPKSNGPGDLGANHIDLGKTGLPLHLHGQPYRRFPPGSTENTNDWPHYWWKWVRAYTQDTLSWNAWYPERATMSHPLGIDRVIDKAILERVGLRLVLVNGQAVYRFYYVDVDAKSNSIVTWNLSNNIESTVQGIRNSINRQAEAAGPSKNTGVGTGESALQITVINDQPTIDVLLDEAYARVFAFTQLYRDDGQMRLQADQMSPLWNKIFADARPKARDASVAQMIVTVPVARWVTSSTIRFALKDIANEISNAIETSVLLDAKDIQRLFGNQQATDEIWFVTVVWPDNLPHVRDMAENGNGNIQDWDVNLTSSYGTFDAWLEAAITEEGVRRYGSKYLPDKTKVKGDEFTTTTVPKKAKFGPAAQGVAHTLPEVQSYFGPFNDLLPDSDNKDSSYFRSSVYNQKKSFRVIPPLAATLQNDPAVKTMVTGVQLVKAGQWLRIRPDEMGIFIRGSYADQRSKKPPPIGSMVKVRVEGKRIEASQAGQTGQTGQSSTQFELADLNALASTTVASERSASSGPYTTSGEAIGFALRKIQSFLQQSSKNAFATDWASTKSAQGTNWNQLEWYFDDEGDHNDVFDSNQVRTRQGRSDGKSGTFKRQTEWSQRQAATQTILSRASLESERYAVNDADAETGLLLPGLGLAGL